MWGLARSRECDSALEEALLRDLGESAAGTADAEIGPDGDASFSAVRGATEEGSTWESEGESHCLCASSDDAWDACGSWEPSP